MLIEIEEQLSEAELQEFYLTAQQWLADVGFMESEALFLSQLIADQQDGSEHSFRLQLDRMKVENEKRQSQITAFMQRVDSYVANANHKWALKLIDDFVRLQQAVAYALVKLKLLKYQVVNIQRAA